LFVVNKIETTDDDEENEGIEKRGERERERKGKNNNGWQVREQLSVDIERCARLTAIQ
jgi:hypothetical protein